MWFEIFKFELAYRKKRPATYLYFAILFLLSFGAVTSDFVQIGGGVGLVKENAPATLATMMVIMSAFFMMITSAIMGVGVLRDFEHNTESLMFSTPIKKRDYLLGRFLGSFVVTLFVFSGMLLGFIVGEFMPWRDAERMLPFTPWNFIHPFLFLVIPNLFFSGVIFFASGALSRKMLVVYTQGILLFLVYQIANSLTRDIENQSVAAIIDPFFFRSINYITQYWTVSEQNSMVIPLEGVALYNRLIWMGVGILGLIATYYGFSFNVVRNVLFKRSKKRQDTPTEESVDAAKITIPTTTQHLGLGTQLLQLRRQSFFYFKEVLREIPFWAMVICGMGMLFVNSAYMGRVFGTNTYPTTYQVLELISGFNLFFVIILVFYSGELIWKERQVKINLIYDAMPMPDFVSLVSKFLGMVYIYILLIFALIFSGVLIQTFKGFYEYNIALYFSRMFAGVFPFLILFTLLTFFVQVMVNNKFLGHTVMILFFGVTLVLEVIGVEHGLLQFGSGSLGSHSEMNGFGHYPLGYSWFNFYWFAFTIILFAAAILLSVRGSEAALKARLKVGKVRLTKPLIVIASVGLVSFVSSGSIIYYNTNVLNAYRNSDAAEKQQADYEKTLKQFEYMPQPKIVDVNLKVDLYPSQRDYVAEGYYILKNKSSAPIEDVHVQINPDFQVNMEYLRFEGGATVNEQHKDFRYYIYRLNQPLAPGDSLKMEFKQLFTTKGFVESGSNTNIVFNGTFLNSGQFPSLGYNSGFELGDDNTRREQDLPPKNRLLPRDDMRELINGFLGDDGDQINFEIILSTEPNQIAISPGYLQREWSENDRRYFHYKMDKPMMNFYSILSAEYEVMRDTWTPPADSLGEQVNLEIYYHKGHEYNLDRMMNAMKASFDYFSQNFSPYQFRQMRILEFPRYATFAQSFANTVPFSEGIGFVLDIDDAEDVDIAFYVTAHELAHQWWGHQVMSANVQGSQVMSESLSQYAALMVMKQAYPEEKVQKFLKQELQRYLRGRATETKREMPLVTVENQNYIHYGKGANVFYTLQDYIGEDSLNAALSRFIRDWNIFDGQPQKGRFPTTLDFMPYIREVTPANLQGMVDDLFEKITLFENKVNKAEYTQLSGDTYEVELTVQAKKFYADSLGIETPVPLDEYIEIGVYGKDENGDDKLLYLQKHRFTKEEQTFTITVNQEPTKAGIDPIYKFIDRNPDDNTKSVSEKSGT